jgi:putative ABC transport system permease protein
LAALLALLGVTWTGWLVAVRVFELPPALPWPALLAGAAGGVLVAIAGGWWGTRRIVRVPPAQALRAI